MNAEQLAVLLSGYRYRGACEDDYQQGVARVLEQEGVDHRREVVLSARDRIDFMVGGLGVEVKMKGSVTRLLRQLGRYAEHEDVEELLLVATSTRLVRGIPEQIHGVSVSTMVLRGPAL